MAELNFNANEVEPQSFDLIPPNEYEAVIVASEMKATNAGTGRYLKLQLQILNGPFSNRRLFDRLNLENPHEKAVSIAKGTLSAICRAVNVMTPRDSSELHMIPLRIKVAISKGDGDYADQNEIKAYKPRHTGPETTGTPVASPSPDFTPSSKAPW